MTLVGDEVHRPYDRPPLSKDFLRLVDGEVAPAVAWATGKLRVEASMLDLLRLRSLL